YPIIATPPKYPVLIDSSARTGPVSMERPMAAKAARPQRLVVRLKCPCSSARIVRPPTIGRLHYIADTNLRCQEFSPMGTPLRGSCTAGQCPCCLSRALGLSAGNREFRGGSHLRPSPAGTRPTRGDFSRPPPSAG